MKTPREDITRYILIGCGALFLNLMYVLVTVPYGIINGGVTSMSMILSRLPLTGLLPVNAWVTIVTGILLLLCALFLGRETFLGSIFSCVCGVAGFNLFIWLIPQRLVDLVMELGQLGRIGGGAGAGTASAVAAADASVAAAGFAADGIAASGDPASLILASIPPVGTLVELILAAIGVGFGYFLCISNNATAVGMDTIALILHRRNERIPVAWAMYAINIIVLLLGLVTYGLICVLMGIAFAGVQAWSLNTFLKLSGQRQAGQNQNPDM